MLQKVGGGAGGREQAEIEKENPKHRQMGLLGSDFCSQGRKEAGSPADQSSALSAAAGWASVPPGTP